MAPGSEGDDRNDSVSSQSLAEETTAPKRQQLTPTTETLTSLSLHTPPLPTLPFDLVAEILCRLPVKFLLQLRCICKPWKSLIDDPKFGKKHLRMSTTCRHHLIVSSTNSSREFLLWDSPILSVFNAVSTSSVTQTQLRYPETLSNGYGAGLGVCSCDGILLYAIDQRSALLWNPSIRKFKILPPLETPRRRVPQTLYSFGYDQFTDNYKIFAIAFCINKNEVSVHTLGTYSWRRIQDFPYSGPIRGQGIFVSGTVNWLAYDPSSSSSRVIVSLDLEKESYQKLLKPDLEKDLWTLGVLRDYLCIFASNDTFLDVWVMKEYGNKESWTKFFSVPNVEDRSFAYTKAVYISEDDQMLLDFKELMKLKLVVYNSRNGTLKIPDIQNIDHWTDPEVYVESLISPCSNVRISYAMPCHLSMRFNYN